VIFKQNPRIRSKLSNFEFNLKIELLFSRWRKIAIVRPGFVVGSFRTQ
jgi:hypothetical protein